MMQQLMEQTRLLASWRYLSALSSLRGRPPVHPRSSCCCNSSTTSSASEPSGTMFGIVSTASSGCCSSAGGPAGLLLADLGGNVGAADRCWSCCFLVLSPLADQDVTIFFGCDFVAVGGWVEEGGFMVNWAWGGPWAASGVWEPAPSWTPALAFF